MLDKKDEMNVQATVCEQFGMQLILKSSLHFLVFLDLDKVRDRNIDDLSGGELQRFACAVVCIQRADMLVRENNCFVCIIPISL